MDEPRAQQIRPGLRHVVHRALGLVVVGAAAHETVVIELKTDHSTSSDVLETHPEYMRQLLNYAEIVGARRSSLGFTATGQLAWTP